MLGGCEGRRNVRSWVVTAVKLPVGCRPFYSLVASITAEELGHVELVSNVSVV